VFRDIPLRGDQLPCFCVSIGVAPHHPLISGTAPKEQLQVDHIHSTGRSVLFSGKEADEHFDLDNFSLGGAAKDNATVIRLPVKGSMTCPH
jgi:hypothetical protein